MLAYRKERVNNLLLFFAIEHYKKTKTFLSQTALYKYLAFFEFRHLFYRGDMPVELVYRAMDYGPVPIEIYDHRFEPEYFEKVVFEIVQLKDGKECILIKPKGKFDPDYFSENELEDLRQVIEIFAQRWVTSKVMSDASHREIRSWLKTHSINPNGIIDPKLEFNKDIEAEPEEILTAIEERYLIQRRLRISSC